MKKLIQKELREHLKVALIGLVIFAVILIQAFKSCSNQLENLILWQGSMQADVLQPLLAQTLLTEAAFFCAIFGTALGWLQIRAEKHPDLWAFLIHRPVNRTTILQSKAVGGLLLYSLGAGLPLLGLVAVVLIPGNVAAPFEWPMTLPIFAIFLVGMVFYFAGLLTGLRPARWYASRSFGLGLAILAALGAFGVQEFWQALVIIVIAGAALAAAVWGSFKTGGCYHNQPLPGKLALILASTVSGVLLTLVAVGAMAAFHFPHNIYTSSYYRMTKDGNIYKATQQGFEDFEIVDLDGKPLLNEKTGQKMSQTEFNQPGAIALSASFGVDQTRIANRNRYASSARFFGPWRMVDKTLWYLTPDGRLVGYEGKTRRLVGVLKPNEPAANANGDFFILPENYYYNNYFNPGSKPQILASSKTAYLVNLETRTFKPFFTATNDDKIGGYNDYFSAPLPVLLVTRKYIRVLDSEGKTQLAVPYEPSYPAYPQVSVSLLAVTNTYAVQFNPDYLLNKKSGGKLLTRVEWVDAGGNISKSVDLPKLPEPRNDNFIAKLFSVIIPPVFVSSLGDSVPRIWKSFCFFPAVICALVSWWLGLRYNFSVKARVGWGVFHLLFGIPGLLAFLAVEEWPAKECCPSCRKLRVVDREKCEHCGADFAPPATNGTEIFEQLTTHETSLKPL